MNALLFERLLLLDMTSIAKLSALSAQKLGKLRRVWIMAALAHSQFHRRVDVGLRKLLLEL